MNKEQITQKIASMEKQLAELKKELEKEDKGIWLPKKNLIYYHIDSEGYVANCANAKDSIDEDRFAFGNYYKTEEEALKMSNYLKYTNLLRKYVEEHSEPIDWNNSNQKKYFSYYEYETKRINTEWCYSAREQGTIYASSEEVLREAISFLGEENIKKYIFGVEE